MESVAGARSLGVESVEPTAHKTAVFEISRHHAFLHSRRCVSPARSSPPRPLALRPPADASLIVTTVIAFVVVAATFAVAQRELSQKSFETEVGGDKGVFVKL